MSLSTISTVAFVQLDSEVSSQEARVTDYSMNMGLEEGRALCTPHGSPKWRHLMKKFWFWSLEISKVVNIGAIVLARTYTLKVRSFRSTSLILFPISLHPSVHNSTPSS